MLKHMKAHHRQEKLNFSGLFFNRFFNLGYNFLIIFSTFFAYNFLRDTSEFFINGIGEGGGGGGGSRSRDTSHFCVQNVPFAANKNIMRKPFT